MGIGPLTHSEIKAWAELYEIIPSPCEVAVLRDLDKIFRVVNSGDGSPPPTYDEPSDLSKSLRQMAVAQKKPKKPRTKKKDG